MPNRRVLDAGTRDPLPRPFEPAEPEPDAARRAAEVEARIDEAYRRGLEEGAAREREALEASFREREAEREKLLVEGLEELAARRRLLADEQRERIVRLALAAAGRIARTRIADNDPVAVRVLEETLAELPTDAPLEVRVHPDDADTLRDALGERDDAARLTLVGDPRVSRGGCLLSGEAGSVRATVETAEDGLRESLAESLP